MGADRSDGELFDHLRQEFGAFGDSAVEFLVTARELLRDSDTRRHPRLAEAIAYCTREALKRILDSVETPTGGEWHVTSRAITTAKQRFLIARGLPGADELGALEDLLHAVDELEATHRAEGIHQRRLIAVLVSRTGAVPLASATDPIVEYQRLIETLNGVVHNEGSLDGARESFAKAMQLLQRLFLPPDARMAELDVLSKIEMPGVADAQRLLALVSAPSHLDHFFQHAVSAAWLGLLTEASVLTPPEGQAPWPVFRLVTNLRDEKADEIANWLRDAYRRWGSSSVRARYLAHAALDLGPDGYSVLLEALRDHPSEPSINHLAASAVVAADATAAIVEEVADVTLNDLGGLASTGHVKTVVEKLCSGITSENWATRIQLICFKVRSVPQEDSSRRFTLADRAGSIAAPRDPYEEERFVVLLGALTLALRQVLELPVGLTDVLAAIDILPDEIASRLRPWIFTQAPGVDVDLLIEELAEALSTRYPCGDDLPLLDRVVTEADEGTYLDRWTAALGPAPSSEEVGPALADHTVPEEWFQRRDWCALLPSASCEEWRKPVALLAAAYGPATRERIEHRQSHVGFARGRSPIAADDLKVMTPNDAASSVAAWRPEGEWLVSARELARALEEVVKHDPRAWAQSPLGIVGHLRQPTYIAHYFTALAAAEVDLSDLADELIESIAFLRSHPWDADLLGDDDFDYDPDWRHADGAGIDLIKKLADSDAGFGARTEQAWTIALDGAKNRSSTSSLLSERDPLETAINRPCTRALEAVFSMMGFEYRAKQAVRPEALSLLNGVLHLPGWDGAEHRAIIAPRLGFLLHIARDWVEERRDLLFGVEAPDDLGQMTVDLAVKWGRAQPWVLEHTFDQVLDSTAREVENAMSALLVGMLWDLQGFDPITIVDRLQSLGVQLLSEAGEAIARLLRVDDIDPAYVERGVDFWSTVLKRNKPESMPGFGWWAEVKRLDRERWEGLTFESAHLALGQLDWAHEVAERAAAETPTTTGLAILNELVRGQVNEWDRLRVMEVALGALRTSVATLRDSDEFLRLRTTLIERGMFDARDV